MIVSLHATHESADGTESLNDIVPKLGEKINTLVSGVPEIKEYVVVNTCNRFEIYTATENNKEVRRVFEEAIKELFPYDKRKITYVLEDSASIGHLFRVVCGLDSLIVGENEIQHQIKVSYSEARENGQVGKILSHFFNRALSVGKRVRSETALNKGAVSVGSAAVELATRKLGTLDGKNVTILGAGDTATVIAKNLVGKSPNTVFVSNRTFERARELASALGGVAVPMSHRIEAMEHSDLVLVATSAPHPVVRHEHVTELMKRRPDKKLLIIDVSLPRNVSEDVAEIPNVKLENIDSLERIAMENANKRRKEVHEAEKIVKEELERIGKEQRERDANEVIRNISIKLSEIREEELRTAVLRSKTTSPEKVMEDLSRALINKITAEVYTNLRVASRNGQKDLCQNMAELFGVENNVPNYTYEKAEEEQQDEESSV
jgi:glutamyl-tRNA reductase